MKKIPLADMIVELRKELLEAQQKGAEADLKFRVEDIEMEVQVAVSRDAETKAGFNFWVIDAKTKGKVASQSMHKLKLKLTPMDDKGRRIEISDEERI